MASKSRFSDVPLAAPDGIFNVLALFKEDEHPNKVNLSVGGEISWRTVIEIGLNFCLEVLKEIGPACHVAVPRAVAFPYCYRPSQNSCQSFSSITQS